MRLHSRAVLTGNIVGVDSDRDVRASRILLTSRNTARRNKDELRLLQCLSFGVKHDLKNHSKPIYASGHMWEVSGQVSLNQSTCWRNS